jgi:hypothetical protein
LLNLPQRYWKGIAVALVTGAAAFLSQTYAVHLSAEVQAAIIAALVGGAIEVPPTSR